MVTPGDLLMCKCTPNMRTPFCGKPGCEWPQDKAKVAGTAPDATQACRSIVADLVDMEYRGDMQAIAAAVIDRDGDVRTLIGFGGNVRIALAGAIALMQHQHLAAMQPMDKPRD
jgi:hypothetical protein